MRNQSILALWALLALLQSWAGAALAASEPSYSALKDQYYQDHPGKGKHGQYWEAIPIQKYWNPKDFYKPPSMVKGEVSREMCTTCHQATTPGAFHAWQSSSHANLQKIRDLPNAQDVRYYKKDKLAEVEKNLVKQGLLKEGEPLAEVGCIDCHGPVGAKSIQHDNDLVMPDRAKRL
jgi:hydroxylamine dehydrogenase